MWPGRVGLAGVGLLCFHAGSAVASAQAGHFRGLCGTHTSGAETGEAGLTTQGLEPGPEEWSPNQQLKTPPCLIVRPSLHL